MTNVTPKLKICMTYIQDCRFYHGTGGVFGDNYYAIEELVAEISSSFTCALLGIKPVAKEETAGYLQSWLSYMALGTFSMWKTIDKIYG